MFSFSFVQNYQGKIEFSFKNIEKYSNEHRELQQKTLAYISPPLVYKS